MPGEPLQTLYKIRSVAEHFQVRDRTICDWIRQGRLEAVRITSGQLRVTEAAMKKLVRPVRGKSFK